MGKYLADCRRWVNLRIQESYRWQASVYLPKMTVKHILIWASYSMACVVLLAYFFYNSFIAIPFLMPLAVLLFYKQWKRWQSGILIQIEGGFKDWLYYIKGGLQAGKSVEHAILGCQNTFQNFIGETHPVLLGLDQIYRGIELHIPLEICLKRFGEETQVATIEDFAVVFEILRKQGGHMSAALEKTIQQIYDKIELRIEVASVIAAKKMEQRVMCIMPFAIMLFIGKTSGGYFTPLYHNVKGILIMSGCLAVYVLCVGWGEKLTDVCGAIG